MRHGNLMTVCAVSLTAALAVSILHGASEDPPRRAGPEKSESSVKGSTSEKESTKVMADKLRHTHELITSLAREDYKSLEKSAKSLGKTAHLQWVAEPSPEYRSQLQVFWTTLEGIESGARRKNIEEATLAYMQMTLSCVRCHRVIRQKRRLK